MKIRKNFAHAFTFFALLCLANAFSVPLFAHSDEKENFSKQQRELVVLASQRNLNLNPHTSSFSIESQILNGLYEGLFTYNPVTLQSENAICEGFKVSRDKKIWTFYIRDDAKFSDGKRITANDVKKSWVTMLKTPNAPFASLLDIVSGVQEFRLSPSDKKDEGKIGITVKDEKTLVVRLTSNADYLPSILCHPSFSVINDNKLVFSGPFTLSNKTKDSIVLKKNPHYWDADNVRLPSIRFIISDNTDENTYLYNTGKIDWIIDGVHTSKILSFSDISISPQFGTEYFFFRPVKRPWDNPTLRLALLNAIDWEKLQQDSIVKATSLLVQLPGYPEIYGVPEFDMDIALEMMEEAGYTNSSTTQSTEPPVITVAVPEGEYATTLAQTLAENWNALGIKMQILQVPNATYFQSVQDLDADLFVYNWIGDFADPMAFLELFRSESGLNVTGWKDKTFDSLLQEASTLKDEQRFEKLAEAEQYMIDQGIIIPISHTVALNILDRNIVKGWYENALNIHPLKNLYIGEQINPSNIVRLDIEKK